MNISVERLPGRTPLLFLDMPGDSNDCVLLYGHFDKQPEFTGWREGLGPWTPVLEGDRLYGRGGADDGYAIFASLTALGALTEQGAPMRAESLSSKAARKAALRPSSLPRGASRPHREAEPRRLSRLGLRELRPALGNDVAARPGGREPLRRTAARGRSFRLRFRVMASSFRASGASSAALKTRELARFSSRIPRRDPQGTARRGRQARRHPG